MSDKVGRVNIWLEAFRFFQLHQKEWIKWAVPFFLLFLPLDIWTSVGAADTSQSLLALLGGDVNALKNPPARPPGHFLDTILTMLVGFTQYYIFIVLFLKQESVLGFPKISLGGWAYYMWKIFLWFLLLAGIFIVLVLTLVMVLVVASFTMHIEGGALVGVASVIVMVPVLCYVVLRYTLIFPLAACRIKSPIKTGVQLIRGQMWRVFLNSLPFWLILAVVTPVNFVLMTHVAFLMKGSVAGSANPMPAALVSLFIMALMQVFLGGVSVAFNAAICAIFVKEKQAVDLEFKLVTLS